MFARHKSKGRWARALLAGTKPNKRKRAMSVEEFESRRMYAVFTVTSDQDTNSAGELRAAVALANVNPGPDTIDFASSVSSIQLMLGELQITGDTLLEGATPAGTAVSIMASPNSRIFRVDDANPLTSRHVVMHSLRLKGGDVTASLSDAGGAVLNNEDLTLSAVAVNSNRAHFGGGVAKF